MDVGEMVVRLRGRAKFLDGWDKRLLHDAADALEAEGGVLGGEVVAKWLEGEGVKLLPWQRAKLGL